MMPLGWIVFLWVLFAVVVIVIALSKSATISLLASFALLAVVLVFTSCSLQDHGTSEGTGNVIYADVDYPSGGTGGQDLGGAVAGELGGVLEQGGQDLGGAGGLEDLDGAGGRVELGGVLEQGGQDLGGAGGLEDLGGAGGLEAPPDLGELAIAAMPAGYTAAGDLRVGLSAGEWLSALFTGEPGRCYQVAAACDGDGLEVALFAGGEQLAHAFGPTFPGCAPWSGATSFLEARARCSGRIAFVPAVAP